MKSNLYTIVLFIFYSTTVLGQGPFTYTSSSNSGIQDWTQDATWSRSSPGLAWPPNTPGQPNTHGNFGQANINGYVAINSGGLNVASASPLIRVIDTLFIKGNVTLASSASMSVESGGLLVIDGDLEVNGSFDMDNTGTVVVTGDLDVLNGNMTNSSKVYTFGNTNVTGGGDINGCDGYSACDFTSSISSQSDLANENENLYNFVSSGGTLPIVLKSFNGELRFEEVALNWVTAKEENFSHFEVERSTEQKKFDPIGFVQGLGESLSDVAYDFTDNNPPFGKIYYRLKSVDIDGSFEYSPIIQVINGFEGKVNLSPNPANSISNIRINLPSSFNDKVDLVSIYDLNGTLITQLMNVDASSGLQFDEPVKAGMYIIKVQHNGVEENLRLLIQ